MSLLTLIEELSSNGIVEKDALNIAIELMKIEKLKELLGGEGLETNALSNVIKTSNNLPVQEKIAYSSLINLSIRERECFLMHTIEGKSMRKIAYELGISKSSVQQYIERARKKIFKDIQ